MLDVIVNLVLASWIFLYFFDKNKIRINGVQMLVETLKIRRIFATTAAPTIEVELRTKKGVVRSAVPIGTSRGRHETTFLPVEDAIRKFALISRQVRSENFYNQEEVDAMLHSIDKSSSFKEIGGNVALGISSAFLKALALEANLEVFEYVFTQMKPDRPDKTPTPAQTPIPIPMPICNVCGGWRSESGVKQSDIQEFLLLPVYQKSFLDSATNLSEAYKDIGKEFEKADKSFQYGKNVESAWITGLGIEDVMEILSRVGNSRLLKLGLDVAASNLWDGKNYVYRKKPGEYDDERFLRTEQLNFLADLARRYPITYIEDPFEEEDFVSHAALTHLLSNRGVLVCGDDLYTTNLARLQIGIGNKATNAALVKPNQIGTITDTIKFVEEAKRNGLKAVMSHRSGETEDILICHLAVGLGCEYVKLGISGERTTKINEMIRIEEKLQESNKFIL